jgi:shikimate kinase
MNIVLLGFMATGKSAVGKALAEKLGCIFYDTDALIEKETGATVAALFEKGGEAAFRELEAKTVSLVAMLDKAVIATGGGVPLRDDNMRELERNGVTVLLTARPATVLERLKGAADTRPLLKGREPLRAVEELLAARKKAYARCRHAVATDGLTPEQVAEVVRQKVAGAL